jgi:adenine deaminase
MTQQNPNEVAELYGKINKTINANGCNLSSPFMTLSFMALLVIPELKIGDKGLFDVTKFEFTDVYN